MSCKGIRQFSTSPSTSPLAAQGLHRTCWALIRQYSIFRCSYKGTPMTKPVNWESRIGRRVRLRDLHILFTVVQHGGMAKAASSLGISQPAVSEAIAGLEHALGARLLDRTRRGIQPTLY